MTGRSRLGTGGLLRPGLELLDTDGLDAEGKQEGDDDDGDD